jgi:predicted nucleotidyltransferase
MCYRLSSDHKAYNLLDQLEYCWVCSGGMLLGLLQTDMTLHQQAQSMVDHLGDVQHHDTTVSNSYMSTTTKGCT